MKTDFLRKRAIEFLETADYHIKENMYPLAAFDLEQALQLYLKYYLFLKLKDFPRTHSVRILLIEIGKAYRKDKEMKEIIEENINLIADLEQVYITSRYLPVEFSKVQVENMKAWVKNIIEFLKQL